MAKIQTPYRRKYKQALLKTGKADFAEKAQFSTSYIL